jgi:hypothetical protein
MDSFFFWGIAIAFFAVFGLDYLNGGDAVNQLLYTVQMFFAQMFH